LWLLEEEELPTDTILQTDPVEPLESYGDTTTTSEIVAELSHDKVAEQFPEITYQLDDGRFRSILYATKPEVKPEVTEQEQNSEGSVVTHDYNLRQHRSNWRSKVFTTAVKIANENNNKYTYRTSIKECKKKLRLEVTRDAIKKELQQMLDKNVFTPIYLKDVADKTRIIPSMMFMNEKYTAEGNFDKLKARLVGMGNYEDKSEYGLDDISSPTVSINSVFIVTAIAAEEQRHVATGDIPAAYLNAGIENLVYMKISKDIAEELTGLDSTYLPYVNQDGSIIVILEKAIYGLLESAKLWYEY